MNGAKPASCSCSNSHRVTRQGRPHPSDPQADGREPRVDHPLDHERIRCYVPTSVAAPGLLPRQPRIDEQLKRRTQRAYPAEPGGA